MDNHRIKTASIAPSSFFVSKVRDYVMLIKLRLSLVVVFSSLLGYLIAADGKGSASQMIFLMIGGFLVTAAANAMNQVLEKDFDTLMTRTANRPIAAGRMKSSEGVMFFGISCLIGISILAMFNPVTPFIAMLSLLIYAFVYTPMKRYSTLAVAVGAIPGALPVMIGATAFDGTISLLAICLFGIQFSWQFPHFWAIGYVGFDDYKVAGYKLLPETNGHIDRNLGLSSMLYAAFILPLICFMYLRLEVTFLATSISLLLSLVYLYLCYVFHQKFDRASALKVMFYSFFYLPFVLLVYWIF